MLSRHPHATKPRYTYQTEPDTTTGQKIILFSGLFFTLSLAAIAINFLYEFVETYHQSLTQAVFYLCAAVGVALVLLIAGFTLYVLAMLMLRVEAKRAEHQHFKQSNAVLKATAKQMQRGAVYLSEQRNQQEIVRFKALPKHSKSKPEPPTSPVLRLPEPETLPELKNTLLSDIAQMQRLLIVGGQNSGKTTLLKHIAQQRSSKGSVLILDSHNFVGKWSEDYRVIGHGRNYQAIETEFKNLIHVMDSRYKEYASGEIKEREHELITIISDEFSTIAENINNLDSVLLPLLTESRKVGIDLILACHSETAQSLGLKGRFDLKKNFDAVLRLKNISGKRIVSVDNWESINEYNHCGEFENDYSPIKSRLYKPEVSRDFNNRLDLILNEDLIKNTAIMDKYFEMKKTNSFSLNKLAREFYGSSNGRNIAKVKAVLAGQGIATP